jgi:ABC-type sulfate transport system permease component
MRGHTRPTPPPPKSGIPLSALIPREAFGLPLTFWIGAGAFGAILLIALGSLLK